MLGNSVIDQQSQSLVAPISGPGRGQLSKHSFPRQGERIAARALHSRGRCRREAPVNAPRKAHRPEDSEGIFTQPGIRIPDHSDLPCLEVGDTATGSKTTPVAGSK